MPKVPEGQMKSAREEIDPTYLAMAAAVLHEQGRLFEPDLPTLPEKKVRK